MKLNFLKIFKFKKTEHHQPIPQPIPVIPPKIFTKTPTILIVDDSETNRYVLHKFIQKYNDSFHVIEAKNGIEAVELFKQHSENIVMIFMDLIMPCMNGYVASSKIREISNIIPIYALTGVVYEESIKKCLEHGINGSIEKPIKVSNLYNIIKFHTGL